MITIIDIIKAFREDGYKPTAWDLSGVNDPPEFCFALALTEPIDIWYCTSVLNKRGWYIGAPYWDADRKTLYFPDVEIDAEAYRELMNDPS